MISGSCLCGQIRYQIAGELRQALHCHCSMCRKATGAAFRTRAAVRADEFQWTAGSELVTRYASSPSDLRTFCSVCGATLITEFPSDSEWIAVALGTLDVDPSIRPNMHVFVGSKAPWFAIADDLPQFDELPPAND